MNSLNRRAFLTLASAGAARLAFGATAPETVKRPNVILILTDDQGSTDVGCYGAGDLHTPNMDALAARGVRFTQFYAAAAICSPSRGALLTGRYPQRNGLTGNAGGEVGLPESEITLADMFKAAGYRTAVFGKWHLGMTEAMAPTARGFDEFFGHKEGCIDNYSHFFYWGGPNRHDLWRNNEQVREDGSFFPDMVVREACRFLDANKEDPFFLYLPFNLPHYPMQAQPRFDALFEGRLEEPRRRYAALLANLDDCIGKVLDKVDDLGLRENTIVVLMSDNGHSREERAFYGGGDAGPYRGQKFTFFEGGIRMPCIVSWPGVLPENETRAQTVSAMDWLPTLAAYCGASLPEVRLDGRDLARVINDPAAPSPHEALHWAHREQWAVLREDWKLVCKAPDTSLPDGVLPGESFFLANLRDDPGESNNLAESHPDITAELVALHERWLEDAAKP